MLALKYIFEFVMVTVKKYQDIDWSLQFQEVCLSNVQEMQFELLSVTEWRGLPLHTTRVIAQKLKSSEG